MKETNPKCPNCNRDNAVYMSDFPEYGSYFCKHMSCEKFFTPKIDNDSPLRRHTVPAEDNQMVASVQATYDKCVGIMRKKSQDYAGSANPYRNFETVERVGVPVQLAIFIRLLDKITRLENLLKPEAAKPYVTEETVEDTIEDAINYLAILKARREMERN